MTLGGVADRFDLQRFVDAQGPVYRRVCEELQAGRKQSHWMWFVFPQIAGLGQSPNAVKFAISSLEEASAFLSHPVLGSRLKECAALAFSVEGRTTRQIFGPVDEIKFRSSMTLFARVAPEAAVFRQCLDKYFGGLPDPATLAKL
jgi:uncharacterized protein (DUF1810 family)